MWTCFNRIEYGIVHLSVFSYLPGYAYRKILLPLSRTIHKNHITLYSLLSAESVRCTLVEITRMRISARSWPFDRSLSMVFLARTSERYDIVRRIRFISGFLPLHLYPTLLCSLRFLFFLPIEQIAPGTLPKMRDAPLNYCVGNQNFE